MITEEQSLVLNNDLFLLQNFKVLERFVAIIQRNALTDGLRMHTNFL